MTRQYHSMSSYQCNLLLPCYIIVYYYAIVIYVFSVLVYVIGACICENEHADINEYGSQSAANIEAKLKLETFIAIAKEIYSRTQSNTTATEVVQFNYPFEGVSGPAFPSDINELAPLDVGDLTLYNNYCLVVFSRLFQRLKHRPKACTDFVLSLPYIPDALLDTLNMLMYSGSLPESSSDASAVKRKRKRGDDSIATNLGSRMASMKLLSQVCLREPIDDSNYTTMRALSYLLWATTSADFMTRLNAINTIVRYEYFSCCCIIRH